MFLGIEDALHYTPERRAAIIAQYPEHERPARAHGIPTPGEGLVFPLNPDTLLVDPFKPPSHWTQIAGIDFGWDHLTAGVRLAWDRDGDVVYVLQEYGESKRKVLEHAHALGKWGKGWLPWAWPHDGLAHGKDGGEPMAAQYRDHGLCMLQEHAQKLYGSSDVEAGCQMMLDRMTTAGLKIFRHCTGLVRELRMYHREDGKIKAENDDRVSALRYAMMCLKYGQTPRPARAARDRAKFYG